MPSQPSSAISDPSKDDAFEPPGGYLVWILVFLELITFGAGLGVFLYEGHGHEAAFSDSRKALNQPIAFINTLVLLTGGWCMANGVLLLRKGASALALRWVRYACLSGVVFTVLKCIEYGTGVHAAFGEDSFFTLYYLLTGFHLIHVLVAVVLLVFMARGIRLGTYTATSHENVEASGIFWHMCDLVWLLLYPIIYLL